MHFGTIREAWERHSFAFAVASEYALQHPDVKVVVIDMCPQANVSEILLGSSDCEGQIFMGNDQIL